jgi:hypothetical protein
MAASSEQSNGRLTVAASLVTGRRWQPLRELSPCAMEETCGERSSEDEWFDDDGLPADR